MGNKEQSALDIAKYILRSNENSLEKLSQLSVAELMKYKGIGTAKAITIAAALEIGNRKHAMPKNEIKSVKSSKDSFQLLMPYFL